MKYSQTIGILACIALFAITFIPWVYIPSLGITLDGFNGTINKNLSFGRQGITHSFFIFFLLIFFAINRIWAKRVNIYIAMINLAWAIKNFFLFSMCRPECPEKKIGIYLLLILAVIIQIMALVPKMKIKSKTT